MSKLNKSEVALSILLALLAKEHMFPTESVVDEAIAAADRILGSNTQETEEKYSIVLTEDSNEVVVSGFLAQAIENLHTKHNCTKFKLSVESGE